MSSVLVIGNGGREHALSWKLAKSAKVGTIYVAPGNGGTSSENIKNVDLDVNDFNAVADFCKKEKIVLVVVGPEVPLVAGISDYLQNEGIKVFGPKAAAAKLEASKSFSKEFMDKHNIPTAAFKSFTDYKEAVAYVETVGHDVVLKASGLAAGKGVLIPNNKEETLAGLKEMMVDKVFGEAGDTIVIEERMEGPEISVFALCDGYSTILLPACQDHKKIGEGDVGLNTGGMGAYTPTPFATPQLLENINETIITPTINGMRKSGTPYVGVLFVGIMLTKNGPRVLEYNCRFGDPETQVLMPMFSDETDLLSVFEACVGGYLDAINISFQKEKSCVTVVAVSGGYPGSYPKGKEISLPSDVPLNTTIFHAGTKLNNNTLETSGGRVLAVTTIQDSLAEALKQSYSTINNVKFDGIFYRNDIAHLATKATITKETYASAGVSIDEGNRFVDLIKPLTKVTRRSGCDAEIGGFGGLFDLEGAGYGKDTIIVGATDGVGTKLKVAQLVGKHDTIGQDLVAMCVNDLIVQGAEPLFFLDYYACGKLTTDVAVDVVKGISDGCVLSNCALIGGETAEMPGMYDGGDYDVAGFSVGATNKSMILPQKVLAGDVLLGIQSSGVHSNGYSLVRRLVTKSGLSYSDPCPFEIPRKGAEGLSLGEALLEPTKIYVKCCMDLIRNNKLKALIHITGGGFWENIPRVLPKDLSAHLDAKTWPLLPVFQWLKKVGNVDADELARTFNCGIGMVLVVSEVNVDEVMKTIESHGEAVYKIGSLTKAQKESVIIDNLSSW